MLLQRKADIKNRQTDRVTYDRTPFGARLFEARTRAGLTQPQVAAAIPMSQSNLSELERKGESSGLTIQLAQLYGVDPHWLATGTMPAGEAPPHWTQSQHPNEGTQIRGLPAHVLSHHANSNRPPEVEWESLVASNLPKVFSVRLRDDSMAPFLRSGHVVFFSTGVDPKPGDCVLVADSSGAVFARMYRQRRPGHWEAQALNGAYQALDSERDQLRVIAVFTGMEGRLGA